jgi:hypothetical protein
MPDPIGYFQGKPVYQVVGDPNAGLGEPSSSAGGSGGAAGNDDGAQTDEPQNDTGSDSGGTNSADPASGSSDPSPSSGVDDSSANAGGGKQGQGQGDGSDDLAGLKKALASERQRAKGLDKQLTELRKQNATDAERALIEAKEAASAEAEGRVKPPLIKALVAAELRSAGVQGPTNRLVGLLDLAKIDLNDDGELEGLDDQITGLKQEFPNLFAAAVQNGAPRAGNANGGSGSHSGRQQDKGGTTTPKPWYQQLADQVLGPDSPSGVAMR